jgi:hypothetical protein
MINARSLIISISWALLSGTPLVCAERRPLSPLPEQQWSHTIPLESQGFEICLDTEFAAQEHQRKAVRRSTRATGHVSGDR